MTVFTGEIAYGDAGVSQTLDAMRALVNDSVNEPIVVDFARRLATTGGVRQAVAQAVAIRQWLASVWRFIDDPPDRELLRSPAYMIREYAMSSVIHGDCDEAAILGAALGKAAGMQADFVVLAFYQSDGSAGRYEHVYTMLTTPTGASIDLDVTKPKHGIIPPISREMTVEV